MTKVVDASAIAAILFAEPNAEDAIARLSDSRLVAPLLLSFELTNICAVKCRREPARTQTLIAAAKLRQRWGIEEMPVDTDAVLNLALETKLSAYDASYLWLALDLDAELVTFDKALVSAWTAKLAQRAKPGR